MNGDVTSTWLTVSVLALSISSLLSFGTGFLKGRLKILHGLVVAIFVASLIGILIIAFGDFPYPERYKIYYGASTFAIAALALLQIPGIIASFGSKEGRLSGGGVWAKDW